MDVIRELWLANAHLRTAAFALYADGSDLPKHELHEALGAMLTIKAHADSVAAVLDKQAGPLTAADGTLRIGQRVRVDGEETTGPIMRLTPQMAVIWDEATGEARYRYQDWIRPLEE